MDIIEEISRDFLFYRIETLLDDLLMKLIVKYAERRLTRSGEAAIQDALDFVTRANRRRRTGGFYLDTNELRKAIEESWEPALRQASFEAFEGKYDYEALGDRVDPAHIKKEAHQLLIEKMKSADGQMPGSP